MGLQQMNICIQYPSLVLNIVVLLVSFKVPQSIPKTFCLNMVFPCLFLTIYILVMHHTKSLHQSSYGYVVFINTLDTLLHLVAVKSYETQATFSVFLAYLSLTKPFFYQKLVASRAVPIGFLLTHVLSWSIAIEITMEVHWIYLQPYSELILYIHTVIRLTVEGIIYICLVSLYLVTTIKLISFYRKAHGIPTNQSSRWRILMSLLLHCTPPNLFLIVGIPGSYCGADINVFQYEAMSTECHAIHDLSKQLITLRLFVTCLTVLFVFKDYRRALCSFSMKIFGNCPTSHTRTITVKSSAQSHMVKNNVPPA